MYDVPNKWQSGYASQDRNILKYFVSLLYILVAIKASLLKFSMFAVGLHKNTISNMFPEISNFEIVDLI